MNNRLYSPSCLDPFPEDLATSLLAQALETLGLSTERLANLSEDEKRSLDESVWRLVTAADVSDSPCHD